LTARTTPRGQPTVRPSAERSAAAPASAASESEIAAMVKRPMALMVAIFVIDLALAGTGAVLLAKGLAASGSEQAPAPPSAPTGTSRAPAPAPTVVAIAEPPPPPAPAPADDKPAPVDVKPDAGEGSAAAQAPKPRPHPTAKPAPIDPYATGLDNEVELLATRSQSAFQQCAMNAGAVHGSLRVAFQVMPDGRTSRIAAIDNTTGSQALAACLVSVIGRWSFAVHPSVASDFVRPFTYP
jgi:hypothetical protein